jgi:phosphohistidine phosphatase SixA
MLARVMLLPRAFASLCLCFFFFASACAGPTPAPATVAPEPAPSTASVVDAEPDTGLRLVVLVRHAEKADDSKDPPLTEAGKARAQCLADLLAPAAVTDVLSTDFQRTRDTVAPVALSHGRTVEVLGDADANGWAARLRALPPGAVAVVAGHSNTLPVLVRDLTGQAVAMNDGEYDRLFVVALAGSGGSMLAMRYCAPSGGHAHLLAPDRATRAALRDVLPEHAGKM